MLKKIFNTLIGRPDRLLGIDIGEELIKVIEMKNVGEDFKITVAKSAPLPSGIFVDGHLVNATALTEFLIRLLQIIGTKAKHVALSVGMQETFRREITLPIMTMTELASSVRFEIDRQVPYPENSFYYDYAVVDKNEETAEMKIILLATPKKMLEELNDLLKNIGLTVVAIDTDSMAIHRSLDNADNSVVVNISAGENTKIIIYQKAVPVVVRSVPIGGNRLTDIIMNNLKITNEEARILKKNNAIKSTTLDKEVLGEANSLIDSLSAFNRELGAEIQRTVEYYSVQHGDITIEKVFLLGEGANINGLLENLRAGTGTDISLHVLNKHVTIEEHLSLTPAHCSRLAVSIGLAMYRWQ